MRVAAASQRIIASDAGVLVLSALSVVALHTVTNGEYGFHRDELATIDDARFLGWGYVVYPPVTPFIARVSLTLFGASMIGLRRPGCGDRHGADRFDGSRNQRKTTGAAGGCVGGRDRRARNEFWVPVPVCFLRLSVVGAGSLGDHSSAEVRRRALVAGAGGRR